MKYQPKPAPRSVGDWRRGHFFSASDDPAWRTQLARFAALDRPTAAASTYRVTSSSVRRLCRRPVIKRVNPFDVPTSTVKKSDATIWSKCLLRNSFHVVFRLRSGDGSIPCCFRILAIVLCASTWPRFGQCSLDAAVTPASVLLCHASDQRSNFSRGSWSSGSMMGASIVFLRDQLPVPCQQRLRSHNSSDLTKQFPAEFLRFDCKSTALIIAESHSTCAHLFLKNPIFFHQVFNDLLLMLVHPASNGDDEKGKWVED
jgi:hypothetical protein